MCHEIYPKKNKHPVKSTSNAALLNMNTEAVVNILAVKRMYMLIQQKRKSAIWQHNQNKLAGKTVAII